MDNRIITISYDVIGSKTFPNYKMTRFPSTWEYTGYEGALKTQPSWIASNAYFSGPNDKYSVAKLSIITLYEKYKKNKYISKFIIS